MKTDRYIHWTLPNGKKKYVCMVMHDLKRRNLRRTFKRALDTMDYGEKVVERWNRQRR